MSLNGSVDCECEWPYTPRSHCSTEVDPCLDRIHNYTHNFTTPEDATRALALPLLGIRSLSGDQLCEVSFTTNNSCVRNNGSYTNYTCICNVGERSESIAQPNCLRVKENIALANLYCVHGKKW